MCKNTLRHTQRSTETTDPQVHTEEHADTSRPIGTHRTLTDTLRSMQTLTNPQVHSETHKSTPHIQKQTQAWTQNYTKGTCGQKQSTDTHKHRARMDIQNVVANSPNWIWLPVSAMVFRMCGAVGSVSHWDRQVRLVMERLCRNSFRFNLDNIHSN
jgi:hypothetical protein